MADWLLIRFLSDPDNVDYLTADAAGRIVGTVHSGPLSSVAEHAAGQRICALAPASDVLLTDAEVPPKSGARIQQIVPFALEEQVAQDIDSLHFAMGRRVGESARVPVAVVSRALVDGWLGQLRDAGLTAECLYADSSLVPDNPGQAVLVLSGDTVMLRAPGSVPVTLPLSALTEALMLLVPPAPAAIATEDAATAVTTLPALTVAGFGGNGLIVYTGETEWQQYGEMIEAVRDSIRGSVGAAAARWSAGTVCAVPARQHGHQSAAGQLRDQIATGRWVCKAWRIAAAMLVGLLVLHGIGSATQLFMLKRTERRLDQSISESFEQAMPGEHNTSNARRRMEARLASVQGSADSSGLLAMLSAVAQARTGASGTALQAVSYRDGRLELQVTAPGADALDHISQQLRTGGWQADLTSGTSSSGAYQGRIQMKPGT